jgi:two-component system, chemotaxis family, response regulator Rcp1
MNKSFNIVLIEDNPIDILILKKTFSNINASCSFVEFHDAEKAIRYLEDLEADDHEMLPDMIITDLHLPKMTGHDFLAILKDDERLRTIPVVMFSNSNSETDIKLAYHLNVNSYIVKPLSLNVYKDTIRSFWNFWGNAARLPDPHFSMRKAG